MRGVVVVGLLACGCSHDWDPFDPRGGPGSDATTSASTSSGAASGPGGASTSSSTGGGPSTSSSTVGGGGIGGGGGSAGGASGGGGSGGAGGAPSCPPGSTTDVSDDFEDKVFGAIWSVEADAPLTVKEEGGLAVFGIPAVQSPVFARYLSNAAYDMTECHVLVHAVQMPDPATNGYGSLAAQSSAGNYAEIIAHGGGLELKLIEKSIHTTLDTLAYDPNVHAWWRIRGSGGKLFWDTSPDGTSWTTHASAPPPWPLDTIYVMLAAGAYQAEPITPGEVHFDDLNLPP